jgi:bacteriorhodopsin
LPPHTPNPLAACPRPRARFLQYTFILSTVLAMSYYAMWTGLGVTFKTSDTTPRVIFWGRYLGHLLAMPLVMVDLSLVYKLDMSSMLSLVSYDIIMYLAGFIGAFSVGAHKWTWWFVAFAFAILITIQLVKMLMAENVSEIAKMLTYIVIGSTCVFPIMWLLGSEGTAALGLSQEVGVIAVVDLVTTVGFGLYFLLNYDQVGLEACEPWLRLDCRALKLCLACEHSGGCMRC